MIPLAQAAGSQLLRVGSRVAPRSLACLVVPLRRLSVSSFLCSDGNAKPVRIDRAVGHFGDSQTLSQITPDPRPMHERYQSQFEKVKRILKETDLFSKAVIDEETHEYYSNLGLNEYYFQTSSPQMIATNLQCVIAAKLLNVASKNDLFPVIRSETADEVFWMCQSSLLHRKQSQNYVVERELEKEYLGISGDGLPWRMQCYRSTGCIFDEGKGRSERLRTYFLQKPEWPVDPSEVSPYETSYEKVADVYFEANKRGTATERIYTKLNAQVCSDLTGLQLFTHIEPRGGGFRLDLAFRRSPFSREFFSTVGDTISMWGFFSQRKYVEPLANGVTMTTFFLEELPADDEPHEFADVRQIEMTKRVERLVKAIQMQFLLPRSDYTEMAQMRLLSVHEAAFAWAASKFAFQFAGTVGPAFAHVSEVLKGSAEISNTELYSIRTRLKQPPFGEDSIAASCRKHPEVVRALYKEFQRLLHPAIAGRQPTLPKWDERSEAGLAIEALEDLEAAAIFKHFRTFLKSIRKTNFWKNDKLSLSFRLDPSFLHKVDYPDTPHGIFFMAGNKFIGFHTRFQDIARGGIRVVQSLSEQAYQTNRERAFAECYNLARTQHSKNKDIPEGGSKGVILLDCTPDRSLADRYTPAVFKKYIDGMLDLLLVTKGGDPTESRIVDRLGQTEVVFCGPDEHTGTGGLMDWACEHAGRRGAWFWKAFTTGKLPENGGIPHDSYGMTTSSVEQMLKGVLQKKGIPEHEATKVMTGGPDGDLGSNSLLMSEVKTIAMVDGHGVLFDPAGLCTEELRRLAHLRFKGEHVNSQMYEAKLSDKGFKVGTSDRDVILPDGSVERSGRAFRDRFHLHPLASADFLNPNGGRPESITALNVDQLFKDSGEPKFKYIVEGGNLFITQDARRTLERRGVPVFKDASANKGGVTSSSMEVLAALALTDEEFDLHMRVSDPQCPPDFYQRYVKEVIRRIRLNAQCEFEVLWGEGERTGVPRCDLTDKLSDLVIKLDAEIQAAPSLWGDEKLRAVTLDYAIPDTLTPGLISQDTLMQRVPDSYLRSIFSSVLASQFYYREGIEASPFAFFSFVQDVKDGWLKEHLKEMEAAGVDLDGPSIVRGSG